MVGYPLAGNKEYPAKLLILLLMKKHTYHWILAAMAAFAGSLSAAPISNGEFTADLNPAFPGILSYALAGNTASLPQDQDATILINGQVAKPEVTFTPSGPASVDYLLSFADIKVSMRVRFTITRDTLTLGIDDIRETGTTVVRSIEFPGLAMLGGTADADLAIGNFPAGSYASEKPEDHDIFTKVKDLEFKDAKDRNRNPRGDRGASYVFVSNGKIAAGIYTNVMEENLRAIVKTNGDGDQRVFTAMPGKWTYREIPTETIPIIAKLVVATDRNGDGKVTWQDGAIAYRRATPRPYGWEKTRDYPIAHIAMNFGSQATNPFLRVLDNAKKIWLYTDGLGQRIQQKGFAGEGHDSSHPDYAGNVGKKQGGRDELNFVMRRGHDFNVLSGIHINAHEYHKEAKYFSPDIADPNAVGWSWLDESYLTDYRYDSAYGSLYQRLDAMRDDLPFLDFAYLDVYYGRGWPGWRMHTKVNSLGIMQFTEFPGVMERGVVWNHVANDWTQQLGGKGDRSEIARFIYFSQKDTFQHEPLLRGSNCDGFMGWHGERGMLQTVKSAINVNLPTKFLQHFELLRQEKDAAWFSGGVRVETDGTTSRIFGRDGQLINSCRYTDKKDAKRDTWVVDNLTFIPWNPYTEDKIYHWNDKGGDSTWELPKSWAGRTSAELYKLTDLGRVFERVVAIDGGKITLASIQANTPYVLYRDTPPALPDMKWSEGGLVKDTGFDSHGFDFWQSPAPDAVAIVNDAEYGQTELAIATPAAGSVRQTISGLTPGQAYAASVWTQITGKREASLTVMAAPPTAPAFIDKQSWKVLSASKSMKGDKAQRVLDGDPKTLWHSQKADEGDKMPHQISIDFKKPLTLEGFVQTARDGLGNGTIKAYEALASSDGKIWKSAASGEFDYAGGTKVTVKFAKPVTARYFRLVGKSEIKGQPFISVAELDMLTATPAATKESAPLAPVTNAVDSTLLVNFTDQSSKYMRNWHRLKVVFTAPAGGRVDLVLAAAAGQSDTKVHFDDVRLVKAGVSKAPAGAKNVVLFEDFENVDEAWGPFMYGWEGPMNTHLADANPPYTNDTIQGTYSLKSRQEGSPNLLYRTVPASLKLKPDTTYKVSFDYLCDKPDCFAFIAAPDAAKDIKPDPANVLKDGSWKVKKFSATFKTDGQADWFIGITKTAKENKGTIVIDSLLVTE